MGWFKNWRESKKKKKETQDIKPPQSSYEIYNQSETLELKADVKEDLSSLDERKVDVSITNTNLDVKKSKKQDKTKTVTTSTKIRTTQVKTKERKMANEKGRNIYYVSARKDKDGKKVGWEVKKENAEKITKLCETKEQAIEFVREKAGNQGSTCIIRRLDGSIEKTMKFVDEK